MIEHFELLKKLYGDDMNNLDLWNKIKQPPLTALKEIKAGRLKGKSDINPQWRMQAMTEQFGACGTGWKYTIDKLWTEAGSDEQVMCFALVSLFTHNGQAWSDAIPGIGGSMLITKGLSGLHSSDEGYKMAVTDALSVAMKSLGMAADIYLGNFDGSKYKVTAHPKAASAPINPTTGAWDNIGDDMTVFLKELASEIVSYMEANNLTGAAEAIEIAKLEQHHEVALWTCFDSKQSAVLKGLINIRRADTLEKLQAAWTPITKEAKLVLEQVKEEAKLKLKGA